MFQIAANTLKFNPKHVVFMRPVSPVYSKLAKLSYCWLSVCIWHTLEQYQVSHLTVTK